MSSAPVNDKGDAVDQEDVECAEEDVPAPPTKVLKTGTDFKDPQAHNPRKRLETVCVEESEEWDDPLGSGDGNDNGNVDEDIDEEESTDDTASYDDDSSPPGEPDRITPEPPRPIFDSDEVSTETGDALKDVENVTDKEPADPYHTPESRKYNLSPEIGKPVYRKISPLAAEGLPGSSKLFKTPIISKGDRVNSLRKEIGVYSPSDSIMSPCTLKLSRPDPKEFFRMRQRARIAAMLSAGELSEGTDSDGGADEQSQEVADESAGEEMDDPDGFADEESDEIAGKEMDKNAGGDGMNESDDEDTAATQEGSDQNDE